ncbi:MAG: Nucleotidyl transferase, partial [archaeon GW2011_AR11]
MRNTKRYKKYDYLLLYHTRRNPPEGGHATHTCLPMKKEKIAISVDAPLLEIVDSKIDGSILRSRSQAIDYFLRKGLREESVSTAVILLKGSHQQHAFSPVKGRPLLELQLEFFRKNGITSVLIITQHTRTSGQLLDLASRQPVATEILETEAKGNAKALLSVRDRLRGGFVVMSGDTYNNFDLQKMEKKHAQLNAMATMGLMTRADTSQYGTAILDGDYIVDFQEKPRQSPTTIVNAGMYLFKPEIFELFSGAESLER